MGSRADRHPRLYRIAERQSGYFTASQALEGGFSYAAQYYQHKAGNWLRDGWGIYRLRHYPKDPDEELVRLMLWSRDRAGETQAVVSHDSALQAYELSDVLPRGIHLTVPPGFRKRPPDGVVLHRADLSEGEVLRRDGYRITTPIRTLLDAAVSDLSPEHLEAATAQALGMGLVRRRTLEEAIGASDAQVRARFPSRELP